MTIDDVMRMAGNLDGDKHRETELRKAIEALILDEREACAQTCIDQGAYREEIEMAHECAWAIRQRSNGEVRGESRLAGEASSREAATSTDVLGAATNEERNSGGTL